MQGPGEQHSAGRLRRAGHSRVQYAGANANGVKELVIAGLILSSRDIAGGIEWCKKKKKPEYCKDVEKAKAFAGHEIKGEKAWGNRPWGYRRRGCQCGGFNLEWRFTDTIRLFPSMLAWMLSRDVKHIMSADTIYKECDYITLHVPLLDGTRQMINKTTMADMKEGVVIPELRKRSACK